MSNSPISQCLRLRCVGGVYTILTLIMVEKRTVYYWLFPSLLLILIAIATGCQVDLANPPRLATATAMSQATAIPSREPVYLPAPTATPGGSSLDAVAVTDEALTGSTLNVWVNETSPEHGALMQDLAIEFAEQYGTNVAVQQVDPARLPDLVNTAVLSGTLPDIVVHPIEYSVGWAEEGILDGEAAARVVDSVGSATFDPAALERLDTADGLAAVPLHGFHQLLLYRSDWTEARNLDVPDDLAAMARLAEAVYAPEDLISGLVIPTESNLVTTHQAFEQLALANGCQLIDDAGEVTILDPSCRDALGVYFSTINQFSPPGVQTDTSARNAYLQGLTGLIMTSPAILPALAGLDATAVPSCAECANEDAINYLASNTGIITSISGLGANASAAAFGNVTSAGITTVADEAAAEAFLRYWLDEGYERWLAVDSELKVPMRRGTIEDPGRFLSAWGTQPVSGSELSLTDIYGPEVVAQLREGVASAPRWGLDQGFGSLMNRLYTDHTISIVLQEMLSGYFGPDQTLSEAFRRVVEFIPGYAFPTATPEAEIDG